MRHRNSITRHIMAIIILAGALTGCDRSDVYSSLDPNAMASVPLAWILIGPRWVAAGDAGTIWASPDASAGSWSSITAGVSDLHGILRGNGAFVVVGGVYPSGPASSVFTSMDGVMWNPGTPPASSLTAVTGDGAGYMAVGATGIGSPTSFVSADGLNWAPTPVIPTGTQLALGVAYGTCGGFTGYAVVGGSGVGTGAATIDGGATWTTLAFGTRLTGIAFAGGVFVAVGFNANCKIITSINPLTWVNPTSPLSAGVNYNAITVSSGRFVAVGNGGIVSYSDDLGDNWTTIASITPQNLLGVAANGTGMWVAVGQAGSVFISTDNGLTWSADIGPGGTNLNAVVYRP